MEISLKYNAKITCVKNTMLILAYLINAPINGYSGEDEIYIYICQLLDVLLLNILHGALCTNYTIFYERLCFYFKGDDESSLMTLKHDYLETPITHHFSFFPDVFFTL